MKWNAEKVEQDQELQKLIKLNKVYMDNIDELAKRGNGYADAIDKLRNKAWQDDENATLYAETKELESELERLESDYLETHDDISADELEDTTKYFGGY